MTEYDAILTSASRLSVSERLDLIDALWQTVPEDSLPPLSDEWRLEIERRSKALDAGTVKTIPWEQVRREAFRRNGINEGD